MAAIWRIYKKDWVNLFKAPVALLLVAALAVLPSVYDWVNVAAVWDPYSNTSGIKIAVASLDQGAAVDGKSFNIGGEVLESLRGNKSLGWTFTDAESAVQGVRRGDYYASIIIPAAFSQRMAGVLAGKLVKPEMDYTVNEKINAIAPKITAKGASAITAQISERFTETLSSTVLTALRTIDREFQTELPVIRKVEQGLFKLEASLPELEKAGKLVLKLQQDWPQLAGSAGRIAALTDKLPEVEQAGKAAELLDEHWGQISDAAGRLQELQGRLPELTRAGPLLSGLDADLRRVEQVLDRASDRLDEAGSVVASAAQALPKTGHIAAAGPAFGKELQQFLERNSAAFAAVPQVVQQNLYLLQQSADAAALLAGQLAQNSTPPGAAAATGLQQAADRLTAGSGALQHTAALLAAVNTLAPGAVPGSGLRALAGARAGFAAGAAQAAKLAAALRDGGTADPAALTQLGEQTARSAAALDGLLSRYSAEGLPALQGTLQQLTSVAGTAATALQEAPQRVAALDTVLDEAGTAIQYGQTGLAALRDNLPAVAGELRAAAAGMSGRLPAFSDFVTKVLPRIQSALPAAGEEIHAAAEFARKDLPGAEEKLRRASQLITSGLPLADKGVNRAAELVRDDLPVLENAVRRAASTVREIKQDVNLEEIAKLLGGDIKGISDFLASPVVMKEKALYPIPNYGSAMTPFYVVLSLWVGGTLLVSLLRTGVDTGGAAYRRYQLYFGRLLTFLTIGILQALVAVLGNIYLLKCYVADKLWFVLFAVLISIIFVTIVFTLVSVFGSLGKGIAIVFMVLQFSSSGGTFPVSTTGRFFQILNPFMPFTYAISLMRESVGGILPAVAIRDAVALILFGIAALVLALTLQKPLERFIRRSAEQAEKSKLIS
ncbi:YhgE/Pip domain-containing protein [Paenibacillus sp. HW567]|uniref:YhgE/Pip domain-containing protein n=1 Tax=Paenibacillus sp. HW567 TaxID=1034769 RepID=UPI00036591BA|nr:YhgE/Pip domain-containing protein [Paenibacillus sp. HW567]